MRVLHALLLAFAAFAAAADQPAKDRGDDAEAGVAGEPADLKRMIGQMIVVGFPGDRAGQRSFREVAEQLRRGEISGVLYLERNVRDRAAVREMNVSLRRAGGAANPPLIAVDQEGGRVERLRRRAGFRHTPSAGRVAARLDPAKAGETYRRLAAGLRDWGFNLNLGPVVDLDVNPDNPIIGRLERSYSPDPAVVARYGAAFVAAHREEGVLTALKHFPGHGSSTGDTHAGLVDVSGTWSAAELEPYRALFRDGYDGLVMTSHVHNGAIQDEGDEVPFTLSRSGIAGTLRGELGFDGVVITDDMQMGAVEGRYELAESVVRAVKAGNDLLLFANERNPDPDIPRKVLSILREAAGRDAELQRRIRESFARVMRLKAALADSGDTR